jgi:ankyrin repeat protein
MTNNMRPQVLRSVYFKLFLLLTGIFMFWVALESFKAPKYLIILVCLTIAIIIVDKFLRPIRRWPDIIRVGGGNSKKLREAINNTDNINAADEAYGRTALHEAVSSSRVEDIRLLIGAGADINIKDKEGRTPLMEAVYFCYEEAVRTLIDAGADVNIRSDVGLTALDFAEQGRSKVIVAMLTNAGAVSGRERDGHQHGL